jgi:hypothetical protein
MSDLIIECSKGKIKVIGHSVQAFGKGDNTINFFQVKGYKWLDKKNTWAKQARYYGFEAYNVVNEGD